MSDDIKLLAVTVILILALGGVWWVGGSFFEARTYNRLTGSQVTTFDAMWVQLRVQAAPTQTTKEGQK